jgi:hypothetical protein
MIFLFYVHFSIWGKPGIPIIIIEICTFWSTVVAPLSLFSVKVDPASMCPLEFPSDSDESAIESGSSALQSLQGFHHE